MNKAYLLTGGNTGLRAENLAKAATAIEANTGRILAISSIYETAAWGNTQQPAFLNQVLLIETKFSAAELLAAVLDIESSMGRVRRLKYDPRVIDIDILFFNTDIIEQPGLEVPHPRLQDRRFVLEPLVEIAPHYIHPVLNKTVFELLISCPDPLDVKKFLAAA